MGKGGQTWDLHDSKSRNVPSNKLLGHPDAMLEDQ